MLFPAFQRPQLDAVHIARKDRFALDSRRFAAIRRQDETPVGVVFHRRVDIGENASAGGDLDDPAGVELQELAAQLRDAGMNVGYLGCIEP